jgi:hypothetical protein
VSKILNKISCILHIISSYFLFQIFYFKFSISNFLFQIFYFAYLSHSFLFLPFLSFSSFLFCIPLRFIKVVVSMIDNVHLLFSSVPNTKRQTFMDRPLPNRPISIFSSENDENAESWELLEKRLSKFQHEYDSIVQV